MSADSAVVAQGVDRWFGETQVLDAIQMDVRRGELFGLIGPSGCGKSTLIRIIVGLLEPTSGEIRVNGVETSQFGPDDRRAIGYLPQEFTLYPTLTVAENARFVAGLYGLGWLERRGRIRELLTFLELWEARKRLARDVSGGMRRRLGLATALLHRPQVLIVDEPAAGLDPALRLRIWEYLEQVRAEGTTVILSTQHIEEAEHCDRIGVMSAGRMIATGEPDALRTQAAIPDYVEIEVEGLTTDDIQALWRIPGISEVRHVTAERLMLRTAETERVAPVLMESFNERGRNLRSLDVTRARFDDVFLTLVART